MLARLSENFPADALLGLETAWCALYFATFGYLVVIAWVGQARKFIQVL